MAPKSPWRDTPRGDGIACPRGRDMAHRPRYSCISMETPVSAQKAEHIEDGEAERKCERPFSTTIGMGDLFVASTAESVGVLNTGAAASLARLRWLGRRNRLLERCGFQRMSTYPSKARFRSGDGWSGGARHAADIPVGLAWN